MQQLPFTYYKHPHSWPLLIFNHVEYLKFLVESNVFLGVSPNMTSPQADQLTDGSAKNEQHKE